MADLNWVQDRAHELMRTHLDARWQFRFDNAKQRAGLTNFSKQVVSVSRHLASRYSEHDVEQTILHEIAHAMAGPRAGHGEAWLSVARSIGYQGTRTHGGEAAIEFAKWLGLCPNGHETVRFRRPSQAVSCARCSPRFDTRFLIHWRERTPQERAASSPRTG